MRKPRRAYVPSERVLDEARRTRARVCELVSGGLTVRAASAEIGFSERAVWTWARRDPAFKTQLCAAVAARLERQRQPKLSRFIQLVETGMSARDAAATMGLGHSWHVHALRHAPFWAQRWRAIRAKWGVGRDRERLRAVVAALEAGRAVSPAARAAGVSPDRVWDHARDPQSELGRQFRRAMISGAKLRRAQNERAYIEVMRLEPTAIGGRMQHDVT